ncbi:hypothetical protein AURANDRAFT_26879 [Aureococcus anophagefferens]|uniref:Ribosome production factor 2 homolog n=1 Tax=Aureococcus anophagefferens TaxID=44056 RepID=F0YAD9_AURAN|nr:hypothetical protein AURANDRAFT_26879 [Aureococcus anophagefferens]EGB08018.1 hypothetical protein AURANDRAFT_26879 [Aureococcus anophagefferens]|eukprot:XP_009037380.1 hypothetical protein AURANDRAFT_26879 [Aureococcus anophagefferens]
MGKKAKSTSFKGQRVTPAGKRFLEDRAPKLRENPKKLLALRGSKTSERTSSALQTLAALKSPFCKALSRRREDLRPFEDATAVEGLAARHDCSLFVVGSHSKKRPHNLVFGRTHDGHLLDMFEFGVVEAGGGHGYAKLVGSKPLLSFVGEWDDCDETKRCKNFLCDLLRGADVDDVNLAGLDHVLASGTTVPAANLDPSGPPLVLELRRDHKPSLELWKVALKQPKELKPKKKKNIKTTDLGDTVGRIHLGKQNTAEIQTRKVKALKQRHDDDDDGDDDDDDDDMESDDE